MISVTRVIGYPRTRSSNGNRLNGRLYHVMHVFGVHWAKRPLGHPVPGAFTPLPVETKWVSNSAVVALHK